MTHIHLLLLCMQRALLKITTVFYCTDEKCISISFFYSWFKFQVLDGNLRGDSNSSDEIDADWISVPQYKTNIWWRIEKGFVTNNWFIHRNCYKPLIQWHKDVWHFVINMLTFIYHEMEWGSIIEACIITVCFAG